ncbi:MAG: polysaccharide export protein [Deltaproteobacteria bacterium]|nr:polysaccharide export protein [Deltaproteobacteria bacterium]
MILIGKKYSIPLFLLLVISLTFTALSPAHARAYQIGPNDVLSLSIVAGGETQHTEDLTVSAEGTINAPFIGPVEAGGLTPSQLEKQITETLARDYFVNPKVNIRIKEYHSLQYYISGAVKDPGLYETPAKASLLELIAKAGGVTTESGHVAYIMRGAAERVKAGEKVENLASETKFAKVDLQRLLDKGDMSANPVLKPGDVVYIPPKTSLSVAKSKIYVEGEVKTPGVYDYQPGMTVLNACVMAGGFEKFAAPNRTKIIRQRDKRVQTIKINLNRVKAGKIPDIELQPGDRVHVPETWF